MVQENGDETNFNITECILENSSETILEMRVDEKLVGTAEIFFHDLPIPHYKLSEIYINPDQRSHGYGAKLMKALEEKISTENVSGLLFDVVGINKANAKEADGMYERHGWIPVPGRDHYMAYNLPEGVDVSVFSVIDRQQAA